MLAEICKLPALAGATDDARSLVAKAASRLLRLPGNTISSVVTKVKNAGWTVWQSQNQKATSSDKEEDQEVESKTEYRNRVLTVLVREAIHNSCHARPDDEFVQSLQNSGYTQSTWERSLRRRSF